jgi:tetratricopeptide (TPR) repeat protein
VEGAAGGKKNKGPSMTASARLAAWAMVAWALAWPSGAWADPAVIERAKAALAAGDARRAYGELAPLQDRLSGQPEYDYLLGVASLDSGRIDEAIIAFERVLALMPNHAGAQMDIARAYYAAGSFDLAEAAFLKLRASNPPPAAQQAISRYLEAIDSRKAQTRAGWTGFGELGIGYDSNLTGVPQDFGAAAEQSFALVGVQPTGNSVKRDAPFFQGGIGAEYSRPLSRGWSVFTGGELRGRAYHDERLFNSAAADVRLGAALNSGLDQWRAVLAYQHFDQEGDAPGDPKPTNDRRMGGLGLDWRHARDTKTQLGLGVQLNAVRFPTNEIEDFDQALVSGSWLKSFERPGVPLLYLTAFGSYDKARNKFADGVTDKSKTLAGARGYFQHSFTPKLQGFTGLALIHRRDLDEFARSTQVANGRDNYGEAMLGLAWQFRDRCTLRLQYIYSRNASNIDIYDFDRHEVSSTIRCDMH